VGWGGAGRAGGHPALPPYSLSLSRRCSRTSRTCRRKRGAPRSRRRRRRGTRKSCGRRTGGGGRGTGGGVAGRRAGALFLPPCAAHALSLSLTASSSRRTQSLRISRAASHAARARSVSAPSFTRRPPPAPRDASASYAATRVDSRRWRAIWERARVSRAQYSLRSARSSRAASFAALAAAAAAGPPAFLEAAALALRSAASEGGGEGRREACDCARARVGQVGTGRDGRSPRERQPAPPPAAPAPLRACAHCLSQPGAFCPGTPARQCRARGPGAGRGARVGGAERCTGMRARGAGAGGGRKGGGGR
jgi:hypothetical protein